MWVGASAPTHMICRFMMAEMRVQGIAEIPAYKYPSKKLSKPLRATEVLVFHFR